MDKHTIVPNEKVRNYIHDDLAFFILSKLPLKSLKRFGCVRKSWSFLFENNHFMNIFRNNFISNHHSCYDDDTSLLLSINNKVYHSSYSDRFENMVELDRPNPFQEENPHFCILDSGSITGILCLYSQFHDYRVVLWNPATKQFKLIPPSPLEFVPPYQQFQIYLHGFGYDHVKDDYKLLRRVRYYPPSVGDCEHRGISFDDWPRKDVLHESIWEIYSLKSNSWKKVQTLHSHSSSILYSYKSERLYLDGKFNWWDFIDSDGPDVQTVLVSFDLVNEVFFTTLIPLDYVTNVTYDFMFFLHLMELCGSIALIAWSKSTTNVPAPSTTFDILVLGEIGVKESWTKLFTVGPLFGINYPIGTGNKGDIIFQREDDELIWFDLSTQEIEELYITGRTPYVLLYRENFISIGG